MDDANTQTGEEKHPTATPTPQNAAVKGDFAKTVLMPGDPLRSKFVAENYFENAKLVNDVRGIQGYTGTYKGQPVSVMASGMGMPSMGIYSYELFNFYDVDHIIRIGTAGAINKDLKVRSVVAGIAASTNAEYAMSQFPIRGHFSASASFRMLETAVGAAREQGIEIVVGNLYTSDLFYDASGAAVEWGKLAHLAVEMEAYGLYTNAMQAGKEALAICTISDHVLTGESLDAYTRQTAFTDMMEIALETAIRL
ncbi:MAG: purine-nucleoside phosphorylase [Clostridiales Family XIII bacterium]|jgi:purine-nucleoside phosphorylase|nr:purine-nucleoside phosphorylase [Clostridiales Family XIII bacterium]